MVPEGPLGRDVLRKLHVYKGGEHPHAGQQPAAARHRRHEPQELDPDAGGRPWLSSAKAWPASPGSAPPSRSSRRPSPRKPKLDAQGRAYATGRRKDAVARVWVKDGTGKFLVNGKVMGTYFARPTLQMIIGQPFDVINRLGQYDVMCTVAGGGLSGQAGAVRHGLSRALTTFDPALRPLLKQGGFLTRDDREVERKKYGKAKARRSFQFSKR